MPLNDQKKWIMEMIDMIVENAVSSNGSRKSCLKIEEKQKTKNQGSRIFLNLVQVDSNTDETTELYLADFDLNAKKDVLSWLQEPCRRRALSNTDTLEIESKFMLEGYRQLFPNIVVM